MTNKALSIFNQLRPLSVGFDDMFNHFESMFDHQFDTLNVSNYPPYNIVQHNNHESSLEIALAGFKKKEVKVYTEHGKLVVDGKKEEKKDAEYVHRGMAQRSFNRDWQLTEDVEIKKVTFEDGLLTVDLGKVVPEHHARKDYL